jgi:chromosome segregation ATPase
MHLLTETAIGDSKEYEILSFEEVEQLKKERILLRNRVDATRRKLALETKLRDAAQSLNRLYSTKGRSGSGQFAPDESARKHRRSLLGSRGSYSDALSRTDDEFVASSRKIDELTTELGRLERRLEETQRRILEHTAGILQMTHKGLKKNVRKQELPRSPESMASANHRSVADMDVIDDFDERSLYRIVPDYVTDFESSNLATGKDHRLVVDSALEAAERRLVDLSRRVYGMVLQSDPNEKVDSPPDIPPGGVSMPGAQIQTHLGYLATSLDAMEAAQAKMIADAQKSIFDSEDQLEDVNVRLHDMLERTNSVGQAPTLVAGESRGKSMQSQLAFSTMVLDRLNERIELLVEQKDILSRQIQQQRELNTKSDSQRDVQIHSLTSQLEETKRLQITREKEVSNYREQIDMLMEQLDSAKQENVLIQQQQETNQNKALQAEKEAEEALRSDLRSTQEKYNQLQAEFARSQSDFELRSQRHLQQIDEISKAKEESKIELERHRDMVQQTAQQLSELTKAAETHQAEMAQARAEIDRLAQQKTAADNELEKTQAEMKQLESEVVRAQTELTVVKAELDGAYGTRAQRAADVSMNPAIQKEIDDLNEKNSELQRQLTFFQSQREEMGVGSAELKNEVDTLQKELKDTIEDYELMTKASIEFEKERDHLEATIDSVRERCESLESQLSEEKLKWLGMKIGAPTETTSTMVLKNEFKKMMRDTRAENVKTLRVSTTKLRYDYPLIRCKAEQDERRRLENVIRSMKKELHQTQTKSNLSQGVTAE